MTASGVEQLPSHWRRGELTVDVGVGGSGMTHRVRERQPRPSMHARPAAAFPSTGRRDRDALMLVGEWDGNRSTAERQDEAVVGHSAIRPGNRAVARASASDRTRSPRCEAPSESRRAGRGHQPYPTCGDPRGESWAGVASGCFP